MSKCSPEALSASREPQKKVTAPPSLKKKIKHVNKETATIPANATYENGIVSHLITVTLEGNCDIPQNKPIVILAVTDATRSLDSYI